jgi:hypothetical protein
MTGFRLLAPLASCVLLLSACSSDDDPPPPPAPTATATPPPPATATPTPNPLAQACVDVGGMVTAGLCCLGVSDFPETCGLGACGCAPAASHEVARCECPEGTCWDGQSCIARQGPSPTPTTTPGPSPLAQACVEAGGSVTTGLCCAGASDFPETCGIGACGCAPSASREVARCECPDGTCWNGQTCVGLHDATATPTPDPAAEACREAGGSVVTRECCASIPDFAHTCGPVIDCMACFGEGTREVAYCECPTGGDCWNGSVCVPDIAL